MKKREYATYCLMFPEGECGPPLWGMPPSDFDELPVAVIEEMTTAMLGLRDRDFALAYVEEMGAKLSAAFEAGRRFGFRFQRIAGSRLRPPLQDEMIHAFEPFLCRERSTATGIARWLEGNRHQIGVGLDAAERCGYFYRAAL